MLHSVMERAAEYLIPFQATIEVTHRCNLSCKHCYIDTHENSELSLSEFKGVLDQLAEAGTLYLLFTGGEILTRNDFFDIASYSREKGFLIMLMTNGTLITPEIAGKIKRLEPLSVGMSLHGACADTHDSITGKKGSFTSTMESARLLVKLGVAVSMQTLLMDSNVHEANAIKDLAERTGVNLQVGSDFIPTRSGSCQPYQYAANTPELYKYLEPNQDKAEKHDQNEKGICKAGRGICSISPTGDVSPCLIMPMKIGNLRESSFSEIWHKNPSPQLQYLRSVTYDDFTVCKDCELIKYCHRCPGVAYSETGEITRPAPSACRNATLKSEFFKRKEVIT